MPSQYSIADKVKEFPAVPNKRLRAEDRNQESFPRKDQNQLQLQYQDYLRNKQLPGDKNIPIQKSVIKHSESDGNNINFIENHKDIYLLLTKLSGKLVDFTRVVKTQGKEPLNEIVNMVNTFLDESTVYRQGSTAPSLDNVDVKDRFESNCGDT